MPGRADLAGPGASSANNEVGDFLEAGNRDSDSAVVANTVDDLATMVDLPQLALGLEFVAAMDHQIIDDHPKARTNPKCIFLELMGLHKTPFTSTKFADYMQWFRQTQPISLI